VQIAVPSLLPFRFSKWRAKTKSPARGRAFRRSGDLRTYPSSAEGMFRTAPLARSLPLTPNTTERRWALMPVPFFAAFRHFSQAVANSTDSRRTSRFLGEARARLRPL
jgi:hypothetical protein